MKKLICAVCLGSSMLYGACSVSCTPNLQLESQTTQSELSAYFQQVTQALSQLDSAYADYQEIIGEQNKLLEDLEILNKENAIEEKKRAFLLNKTKQMLGTSIDEINSREK
jgi:hypothetical protein